MISGMLDYAEEYIKILNTIELLAQFSNVFYLLKTSRRTYLLSLFLDSLSLGKKLQ